MPTMYLTATGTLAELTHSFKLYALEKSFYLKKENNHLCLLLT